MHPRPSRATATCPFLDCHDLETALASLGGAVGVPPDDFAAAIRAFDESSLEGPGEDPAIVMPRELLTSVGADIDTVRLGGAYYFHGTRVRDPDVFRRRGLLPLDQLVEEIWEMLYQFVSAEQTSDEWAAFRRSIESGAGGHDGWLYRLKTSDALHYGPHGLLVRETLLDPHATGSHDYLGCPEIIQDIARCYQSAGGGALEARFCADSVACIVKFRNRKIRPGTLRAACWYVWSRLRNQELTSHATCGFDGEGAAVPPDDVLGAEVVT